MSSVEDVSKSVVIVFTVRQVNQLRMLVTFDFVAVRAPSAKSAFSLRRCAVRCALHFFNLTSEGQGRMRSCSDGEVLANAIRRKAIYFIMCVICA